MGRGRQKAKQIKVARELKYHVQNTDYKVLSQELHTSFVRNHGFDLDSDCKQKDNGLQPSDRDRKNKFADSK